MTPENAPVFVLLALLVLAALVWFLANYNRFVRLQGHLRESWSGIDVELKRRHDLVPNLVATVRAHAAHEREVMERVTALRNDAVSRRAGVADLGREESRLDTALRQLVAVAESYPQLKADASFRRLQEELAITEDRIAAARRFYNANVRDLCNLREQFPTSVLAAMFSFDRPEFFAPEADAERETPRV
ncbi:MAG: hypothetical protein RL148_357 [Planctomycetota bacterium]|jgi:LemA protein